MYEKLHFSLLVLSGVKKSWNLHPHPEQKTLWQRCACLFVLVIMHTTVFSIMTLIIINRSQFQDLQTNSSASSSGMKISLSLLRQLSSYVFVLWITPYCAHSMWKDEQWPHGGTWGDSNTHPRSQITRRYLSEKFFSKLSHHIKYVLIHFLGDFNVQIKCCCVFVTWCMKERLMMDDH